MNKTSTDTDSLEKEQKKRENVMKRGEATE